MIYAQNYLTSRINEHLTQKEIVSNEERARKNEQQGPRFYPSSMNKCSRCITMDMLGYQKSLKEPKLLKIMECGNSMHERYQTWFEEMGILVANEFPIKVPEYRISGRLDSIIRTDSILPGVDDIAIVELKSANDKKFNKMVKDNEPSQDYYAQLQLYLHLLQIPYGVIYVENKDKQDPLEFWVDYDPDYGKRLIDKVVYVNEYVTKNKLPKREHPRSSFECKYCDFCDTCWSVA